MKTYPIVKIMVLLATFLCGIAEGVDSAMALEGMAQADISRTVPSKEFKIGAYYFGYWSNEFPADQLAHVERTYGRKNDWWAGVRDLYNPAEAGTHALYAGDFSHLKPSIGYYDLADQSTIESHIAQAKSGGLDYFNFYWYWDDKNKDEKYGLGLTRFVSAKNRDQIEFMLSIVASALPAQGTAIPEESYQRVIERIINRYFSLNNYLKSPDGRPMIQIIDDRGIGDGSEHSGDVFLRLLKEATKLRLGVEPYIVANTTVAYPGRSDRYEAYSCSDHFYFPEGAKVTEKPYESYVTSIEAFYRAVLKNLPKNKPFLHCVSSGRDERPRIYLNPQAESELAVARIKKLLPYYSTRSPILFERALRENRRLMETSSDVMARYLIIYAWNEWNEGGIIEPNVKDGTAYLQAIANVFAPPPVAKVNCDSSRNWKCDRTSTVLGTARFDEHSCTIYGWAGDIDRPEQPLDLKIYVDVSAEQGGRVATIAHTDLFRFDVNAETGLVGNHGFKIAASHIPAPNKTRPYEVFVYGVNLPGTPGRDKLLNSASICCSCEKPSAAN